VRDHHYSPESHSRCRADSSAHGDQTATECASEAKQRHQRAEAIAGEQEKKKNLHYCKN
jgi:hypothetical protein